MSSPDSIAIQTCGPIHGSIRPPGSKSITNRALIIAALAAGKSTLTGALASEDTQVMIESLARLGIGVEESQAGTTLVIHGSGGNIPQRQADLFVGNSGTTVRFLTAMLAACQGTFRLDGIARMRERPIADLLNTLNALGSDATSEQKTGCPPVLIRARGLTGGRANIRGDVSSQFLSALLMAAPYAREAVRVHVDGVLVSQPYVHMTLGLMRAFGVNVDPGDLSQFTIPGAQQYQPREYAIEPDASAASYFWGAAAVTGGEVTVRGLGRAALQGDVDFVDCLEKMGCEVCAQEDSITVVGKPLRGIEVDMNAISDTAQTLGVVALFAKGATTIRGIAHVRHKETDRIGDLARELRKFGAQVDEFDDGMRITPPTSYANFHGAAIATYNDHRMAMSLALTGLNLPGVVIHDPGCTAKTYPHFFSDLTKLIAGGDVGS
ncbi:3-phosphoshikimate 1-carboxyvinyltransferase [Anatilimnocola aggregata]|uniref:3-phosphoshikimate 1-carboxyvinyltransferase n=1 Tax=Anatilimnocola aggregata TaxID=2528021 RepID=A0A517Y4X2_9BACT|nr:3-phosphoshikimate 1-carboxyvinyltransferase [Anatilimnocola aggregata]QDU25293.1 3-phosphoshikimate 1-carboxyvinyltransferase [Anatilimnocola aggregata]